MKFDSLNDLKRNAHKIDKITLVKFEQIFPQRPLPHRYMNEPRKVHSSTGKMLTLIDDDGSKSYLDWPVASCVSLRNGEFEINDAGAVLVYRYTIKESYAAG